MANESKLGRDGYILAFGRRLYQVYKQNFPMEFWYGLTPDANREDSAGLIDVRTLPEKYCLKPLATDWSRLAKRSFSKAIRDQEIAHAMAFAAALADGYDLEEHVRNEEEREQAEWNASKALREKEIAENKCRCCGLPLVDCEVPF